ncbi:MAG: hypothetical protein V7K48_03470 [Nostoc sp.]
MSYHFPAGHYANVEASYTQQKCGLFSVAPNTTEMTERSLSIGTVLNSF